MNSVGVSMERTAEPELMLDETQVAAYAAADFYEPNTLFMALFQGFFTQEEVAGYAVDLGCGPGEIAVRFARTYPRCRVDGIDGSPNMLDHARQQVARSDLADRVEFQRALLPCALPRQRYDVLLSNSLLHHLTDPMVLWTMVRQCTQFRAAVLVMDLMRPRTANDLDALVLAYAAGAPDTLQRDFRASLRAAYRPQEVQAQLVAAGLQELKVIVVSDRHLAVWGRTPALATTADDSRSAATTL